MNGRRTIGVALLGLLLGAALGLLAGWVVWPAQYNTITPELLAGDHQIDYANMIATAYTRSADLDLARSQLDRLGPAATAVLRRAAATDPAVARLLADLDAPAAPSPSTPPAD
jgi:hypothetical protein